VLPQAIQGDEPGKGRSLAEAANSVFARRRRPTGGVGGHTRRQQTWRGRAKEGFQDASTGLVRAGPMRQNFKAPSLDKRGVVVPPKDDPQGHQTTDAVNPADGGN